MRIGSLFAGIGGLELGLEWAGVGHTVWQVEINDWCREVLAKHWPDATRYEDITTVDWSAVEPVEVLCGGFPCQDISTAGLKDGMVGQRSGLWREFARAVRELRPRYVVVENVAALLGRGFGDVLGDLATSGYDAEWDCIRASEMGAPIDREGRDRVFIVAYPNSGGLEGARLPRNADRELVAGVAWRGGAESRLPGATSDHWAVEPDVGRVAHGVPRRVDRIRGLGNAVVPQVAEVVGRRLLEIEASAA